MLKCGDLIRSTAHSAIREGLMSGIFHLQMRFEDREGIDFPSDHKLIWVHITGSWIKCDEGGPKGHRVVWSKMGLE